MADRTERLSIVVTAQDLAAGKLSKVRSELAQMGRGGQIAAVGLGTGIKAVRTLEGAASHLGGVIGKLKGPAGLIGLTGAIFGLQQLLSSSVTEAATFGQNVANVTAVTNLAVPVASSMVDTLDKWGISSERLLPILGKLEKNVGTLATTSTKAGATSDQLAKAHERVRLAQVKLNEVHANRKSTLSQQLAASQRLADAERTLATLQAKTAVTTSGAAQFQKEYGVSLLNSKGQIADANELLLRSADYFNSNATATQKATFMSKLWGKGWQDLVPILAKGSAFIKAQEADSIHLTDTQLANITKYRAAQRDFEDAWGDAQVKIGATIMPGITDVLKTTTSWLDQNANKVADFFDQGLQGARRFAGFITGTVVPTVRGLAGTAKGFWDGIPEPLRDILVKGFVADRTIHFLFGLSPGKLALGLVGDVLGPILGRFTERGSSPANPVFVSGIGGVPGVPGAGGALGLASKVFLVGEAIGLALLVNEVRNGISDGNTQHAQDIQDQTKKWLAALPNKDALISGLAAVDKGINDIQANPLNVLVQGEALDKLRAMRTDIAAQLAKFNERGGVGNTPYGPWTQPGLNGRGGMGNAPYGPSAQAGINARGGVGNEPYGPYIDALAANTAALNKSTYTSGKLDSIYSKAAKARGVNWIPGVSPLSTTLVPRIRFMGGNHKGSDLAAEADALIAHVMTSNRPLYTSAKNQERILRALERGQTTALRQGDIKSAARIGKDITALKAKMAAEQAATTRAIQKKDLMVKTVVNLAATVALSMRDVANGITVQTLRTQALRNFD